MEKSGGFFFTYSGEDPAVGGAFDLSSWQWNKLSLLSVSPEVIYTLLKLELRLEGVILFAPCDRLVFVLSGLKSPLWRNRYSLSPTTLWAKEHFLFSDWWSVRMLSVPVDIVPPRRHSWVWCVYNFYYFNSMHFFQGKYSNSL